MPGPLVDPKEISDLLLLLYSAGNDEHLWYQFIQELQRVTAADGAALLLQDLRTGKAEGIWSGFDDTESDKFLQYYSRLNPWLPTRETTALAAGGQVDNSDDVLSLPALRRTAFYNDWGKKNNVVHSVSANIGIVSGCIRYVAVNRGENGHGPASTEKAFAVMELLVDHMRNAFRLQEAVNSLGDLRQVMQNLQFPVYLLDREGKLLEASNDAATASEQAINLATLSESLAAEVAALEKDPFSSFRLIQMPEPVGGTGLLSRASNLLNLGPREYILVLLHPTPNSTDGRAFNELFHLTPAEGRFVQTLVRTGSLDLTLDELKLTRNTGRSHMRSIFHKTGTNRQGQVIQLFSLLGRIRGS
ncbi:LuxR family transcriptional regulator [Bryobacterales bacterium F-183]|nr:LuxR family transcriptional regulator [Bryobacterales bacterium F-183]